MSEVDQWSAAAVGGLWKSERGEIPCMAGHDDGRVLCNIVGELLEG